MDNIKEKNFVFYGIICCITLLVSSCANSNPITHQSLLESYLPSIFGEVELLKLSFSPNDSCMSGLYKIPKGPLETIDLPALSEARLSRDSQDYPYAKGVYMEFESWRRGPIDDDIVFGLSIKSRTLLTGDRCLGLSESKILYSKGIFYSFGGHDELLIVVDPASRFLFLFRVD